MKVRHSVQSIVLLALLAGFSSLQAQVTIATVGTDIEPIQVVNNASTNQVYVLDRCGLSDVCGDDTIGTVTVINSSTFATQRVVAAVGTVAMAINTTTNKVYVANSCGNDPTCESPGTVTVIDGNTLGTQSVTVGINPEAIGVDSVRNKIYVGGRDDRHNRDRRSYAFDTKRTGFPRSISDRSKLVDQPDFCLEWGQHRDRLRWGDAHEPHRIGSSQSEFHCR